MPSRLPPRTAISATAEPSARVDWVEVPHARWVNHGMQNTPSESKADWGLKAIQPASISAVKPVAAGMSIHAAILRA